MYDTRTGLWLLSIAKKDTGQREKNMAHSALNLQIPHTHSAANASHTAATSVYVLPYMQQHMEYGHHSFYKMQFPTLVQAIQNHQLTASLCMTVENAKKYGTFACDAKRSQEATTD